MKKVHILIYSILFVLNSCVYDTVSYISIKNSTDDTLLICSSRYNDIDSVEYCIGFDMLPIEFDDTKKVIIGNANCIVLPDSAAIYRESGHRHNLFRYNEDHKGYFLSLN